MKYDFYAIAIGNGTAATRFAGTLSARGLKTAVIGPDPQGGTCINRGCMPTKELLDIAKSYAHLNKDALKKRGIVLSGDAALDFDQINWLKKRDVEYFRQCKIEATLEKGVIMIEGKAHFVGDGVMVGSKKYRAKKYLVAVGSEPATLPIPGLGKIKVMTSSEALSLKRPPKSLVIQGAGPIGLEFAQYFARVRTKVWLINRSPLLSHFDPECGAELTCVLLAEPGLTLKIGHTIKSVAPTEDDQVLLTIRDVEGHQYEHTADRLMMAVGRKPALKDLGLKTMGIVLRNGRIPVNRFLQSTANPDIYVAGDALGTYQVLHAANQEAEIAAHNAAVSGMRRWFKGWSGLSYRTVDYGPRMQIIFTDPPFVQVGISEQEARAQGLLVRVTAKRFEKTGRARVMGIQHGLWKLISDRETGEILGSSILGPRAEELGHIVAVFMQYRGTTADVMRLPWYHPTLAEVIKDLA